jgi:anaerobic selenocysteine-containing dehydrogenase
MSEIQLRVGDARQRDVGRGIARIDQRTMQKLGISAGDVIEIVNKRTILPSLARVQQEKTATYSA